MVVNMSEDTADRIFKQGRRTSKTASVTEMLEQRVEQMVGRRAGMTDDGALRMARSEYERKATAMENDERKPIVDRVWYYLLDWLDRNPDDWQRICRLHHHERLHDFHPEELVELFDYASRKEMDEERRKVLEGGDEARTRLVRPAIRSMEEAGYRPLCISWEKTGYGGTILKFHLDKNTVPEDTPTLTLEHINRILEGRVSRTTDRNERETLNRLAGHVQEAYSEVMEAGK